MLNLLCGNVKLMCIKGVIVFENIE